MSQPYRVLPSRRLLFILVLIASLTIGFLGYAKETTITEITCDPAAVSIGEETTCTVRVTKVNGDPIVGGTITITTDGDGTFIPTIYCPGGSGGSTITCSCIYPKIDVYYIPDLGSQGTGSGHTLTASYSGSDDYYSSTGTVDLLVIKRLTETVLSCNDSGACSVSVTDEHPEGSSQIVIGEVEDENGGHLCYIINGSGSFTFVADEDAKLIVAHYTGSGTHYESISGPYFYPQDGLGEACLIPVGQMITSTNTACYGLNVAAIIVGSISDITCAWLGTVPLVGSTLSATCTSITTPITFALSLAAETNCYDADGDGIPIWIEEAIGTNPSNSDTDNDGLSDGEEIDWAGGWLDKCPEDGLTYSPSPLIADSDGDGLNDGDELFIYQTDFSNTDTDDDGLTDYEEVMTYHTDPNLDDTDGDGVGDAVEVGKAGYDGDTGATTTDPLDNDTDDDGLTDGTEDLNGNGVQDASETDPNDFDTDDDGLGDGFELGSGCGCNPLLDDTDSDGLSDSEEVNITQTSCSVADSDGDGLNDANEFIVTSGMWPERSLEQVSDPLSPDTDGDGLGDQIEYPGSGIDRNTTAPPGGTGGTPDNSCPYVNDADSDDDGLQDGYEVNNLGADIGLASGNDGELEDPVLGDDALDSVCDPDSDGDGLLDGEEVGLGTDPLDWDSDNDGLSDREELQIYFTDPNNDDTDGDGADGNIAARDPTISPTIPGHSGNGSIAALSDCEEALSGTSYPPFGNPLDETDPLQLDTDGDGLSDAIEFRVGCSCGSAPYSATYDETKDGYANSFDSDGDGLRDDLDIAAEVNESSANNGELYDDPTHSICDPDSDGDGLLDGEEVGLGTDPLDWDSDNDGLSDREELQIYFTDPNNDDTDGDGADGNIAARDPTISPTIPGHSGNGSIAALSDCEEALSGTSYPPFGNPLDETDPLQLDTDGDGLSDAIEFRVGCSCGSAPYSAAYDETKDGYANSFDSDNDGLRDGDDTHADLVAATIAAPGMVYTVVVSGSGDLKEQNDDDAHSICDPDSDGDGLLDGEEYAMGTNWLDWDTDDDGRNDWHEHTGGGPIPTDPFDPDTDDDGLLDSAEVFGTNPTNPVNADTDGDGLCDGGGPTFTPSGTGTNPLCSCMTPPCETAGGIIDHPNPNGLGEDQSGDGSWDAGETDPNQYDTDGDAVGDGVEKLGFSTSRQWMIPAIDFFGRSITVTYPACGCLDPLNPDTDGDGLTDGYEDANSNGNFDFLPSDFDYTDPLPGPTMPGPSETNPCDPDTDNDGLNDYDERFQPNPAAFYSFNRTNPLDHDTDNDWLLDGEEIAWTCVAPGFDLDPDHDGVDDYYVMGVICDVLDPTNRDSDSDGILDGLDPNPCASDIMPIAGPTVDTRVDTDGDGTPDVVEVEAGTNPDDPTSHPPVLGPELEPPLQADTVDTDGDGFSDSAERAAATNPNDPDDHPIAYTIELDLDEGTIDQIWLEDLDGDGQAESVALDLESNGIVDMRIGIVIPGDVELGDFDTDGFSDDIHYTARYAVANSRYYHTLRILIISDLDCDLIVDWAWFVE